MTWLWFLLAGMMAGILSGMGMGGGTVLIPILTLLLGVNQHAAQGINMLAFLPGALLALFVHRREGRIDKESSKPLLKWGLPAAVGGALLATNLTADWLKRIFGIFLLLLAAVQWFKMNKARKTTRDLK